MLFTKKLKHRPYIFLIGLFISISAWAQIPRAPESVQSPTTASLGAFGDIPVSPFAGKPDINVNLYNLSEDGLNIPIALNYDASGVRPDAHPGWVGLNFNLSTNYAVVRTIRDGPDDCPDYQDARGKTGYLFNASLLNNNNWATTTEITNDANDSYLGRDMEPDEFSFNVPGISGKFYRGQDNQWKVICDRPVSVSAISNNLNIRPPFSPAGNFFEVFSIFRTGGYYREHAQGFYIKDEFGTVYEFGGENTDYMEYSLDFFKQGEHTWSCNAWYLKSIRKITGQIINFTYERGPMVAQMYFSVYKGEYSINGGGFLNESCSLNPPLLPSSGNYNGKIVSPIYLKTITSQNYKVNFVSTQSTELRYSEDIFSTYINWYRDAVDGPNGRALDIVTYLYPCFYPQGPGSGNCVETLPPIADLLLTLQWRKLDKIQIQNGAGTTIKEFELSYNNVSDQRLMLKKVQEKSGYNETKLPPYEFSYFESPGLSLPPYAKSHTDHWGYNNGKLINTTTDFSNLITYGDTYRSPSTDDRYVKLGILTKIKYPTSGFTEFTYEPHSYSQETKLKRWEGLDVSTVNKIAGGLRIKKIRSYDPNISSSVMEKKFYYLSGFNPVSPDTTILSSGILGGKSQYYYPNYEPKPSGNFTYSERIFSTQSVLPVTENSQGAHIGYSEVIERSSTGGWTIHKFTNFDNGYGDLAPSGFLQTGSTPYQPYNSEAYKRGKLLSKVSYFENGNRASRLVHTYQKIGDVADYSARWVKTDKRELCTSNTYVYEGTATSIYTGRFLPVTEANYTYAQDDPSKYVVLLNVNEYKQNGQLQKQYTSTSKGDPNAAISKYILNTYKYPNDIVDPVSSSMVALNMIGMPVEITTQRALAGGTLVPTKWQRITYDIFTGVDSPNRTLYIPKMVQTKLGAAATAKTEIEFLTYNSQGKVLTYKEANGITTKMEYYSPADAGKADWIKAKTVGEGFSISQNSAFDYKSSIGVQTIQDQNSKVLFYEYDDFNRLKSIRNSTVTGAERSSYCYNYVGQIVACATLAPTGSIGASALVLIADQGGPLPVTLIEFKATKAPGAPVENSALLNWSTTNETNSDHFDIERSGDGKQWNKLGTVQAMGESSDLKDYSFTDTKPLKGENLYRLKMTDKDGTFAYSRIQSVSFDNNAKVSLYPNPVTIGTHLNLLVDDLSIINNITVYDTKGKIVHKSLATREINTANLSAGLYVVQITYTDGSMSTHRVVKQ